MVKPISDSISKEERAAIIATAATLKEASDELYKLAGSKVKDQADLIWLVTQTYKTILKLMEALDIDP